MSYLLPHLHSGWAVDQAILAEEERVVIIRFGHDWDDTCMQGKHIVLAHSRRSKRCVLIVSKYARLRRLACGQRIGLTLPTFQNGFRPKIRGQKHFIGEKGNLDFGERGETK
ncbi:Dim1 family - like 2 [Theobroma cacao]|nr:Dim1 family - like 2 [Theobroma cacao]